MILKIIKIYNNINEKNDLRNKLYKRIFNKIKMLIPDYSIPVLVKNISLNQKV